MAADRAETTTLAVTVPYCTKTKRYCPFSLVFNHVREPVHSAEKFRHNTEPPTHEQRRLGRRMTVRFMRSPGWR
jgi:hypothetical protein